MLSPYPNRTVPLMVTSRDCDTVCCDEFQPLCPLAGRPGYDVSQWVSDAQKKMGLAVRWDLVNSSGIIAEGGCEHKLTCDPTVAEWNAQTFPVGREDAMLSFLSEHTSDTGCWDRAGRAMV